MKIENHIKAELLKDLMQLNDVCSITLAYSGSGATGSIDILESDPQLPESLAKNDIFEAAKTLLISVVAPNYDGCGSCGLMTFEFDDDGVLVMSGDHNSFMKL